MKKINNIKKSLITGLMFSSAIAVCSNVNSFASSENIDLTDRSIVRSFGGASSDVFCSAVQTSDKGVVTVGYSTSEDGGFESKGAVDAIIVKHDKYGKQEWIKNFGGSKSDYFNSIVKTSDGGFVTTGYSESTDLGLENKGSYDAVIVKYNSNGDQQWVKSFGGSSIDYFYSVVETSDKGFVAVGEIRSTDSGVENKGSYDAVIVKYNSNGDQQWVKSFGGSGVDKFSSVVETSDEGLIAVGYSGSTNAGFDNKGSDDAIIVKYDKDGDQQWVKSFGGSGVDKFSSVVETSDKGFVAVGEIRSTDSGVENKGSYDAVIVKCNSNGDQQWVKSFGGSGVDKFSSVVETSDEGLIAVGYSESANAEFENKGRCDAIIVKYNKEGNQQWVKSFGGYNYDYFNSVVGTLDKGFMAIGYSESTDAGFESEGGSDGVIIKYTEDIKKSESVFLDVNNLDGNGSNSDYFNSVIKTSDGGFIAVGDTKSINLGFEHKGFSDAIIIKYSSSGRQEWIKSFGGSDYDYFYSIVETSDKGFIAVGYSDSTDAGFVNKGGDDGIIVKYDKNGNQLWVKSFGGSDYDYFESVIEASGGGFVAVGYSDSTDAGFDNETYDNDAVIVKYDSNGGQQWVKSFGGSDYDYFYSIVETSDKGFVAVGYSESTDAGFVNKGRDDGIIVKYDKDGRQEWIKSFGGSSHDYFYSIVETSDKGFVTVGEIGSTDAGFVNKGSYDAVIVKYDNEGNQQWVKSFGGSGYDYFKSVVETSDKGFVAVGYSESTDAGFNNKGESDGIIVKYDSQGGQQWVKNFGGSGYDYFKSVVETSDKGFVAVGCSDSIDAGFNNEKQDVDAVIVKYDSEGGQQWVRSNRVHIDTTKAEYDRIRAEVNKIDNEEIRRYLNEKLDKAPINLDGLELKTASASLDVYIKSENMLSLSLDTNSVTFENYSGVQDLEMLGAVSLTVNSSLPYQINAYMPTEISNADGSEQMPIDILNIREGDEADYNQFKNTTDEVVLKDGCPKGNDIVHSIDLKLASNQAHKADIYKTVIKFEAVQK